MIISQLMLPGSSSLESNIKYKHSWGNAEGSLETACNDMWGYSNENPCPDVALTHDTRLHGLKCIIKLICFQFSAINF